MPGFVAPDVLVLAGGGVIGEAWMTGLLAGIEDEAGADLRDVEAFVGTSAGAIVAARLAAGALAAPAVARPPRRRRARPSPTRPPACCAPRRAGAGRPRRRWRRWPPRSRRPAGRSCARPCWRARPTPAARSARLHDEIERSGARFDGRLRVCCVDKRSGKRVVFGAPGAPRASVADAVTASCAIPWVFAPVRIGEREYVDGGVWSVTNLDAAPARRETEVLCLDPTASLSSPLRQAFRVAISVELQILRRRGARVRHVGPDAEAAAAMGTDFMATEPSAAALAAGHRQGRALARTPPPSGA